MTPSTLRAARLRLNPGALRTFKANSRRQVTISALAKELELSRHALQRQEAGQVPIRRWLGYAMAAIAHGLPPME
jgi:hypothetical protein